MTLQVVRTRKDKLDEVTRLREKKVACCLLLEVSSRNRSYCRSQESKKGSFRESIKERKCSEEENEKMRASN